MITDRERSRAMVTEAGVEPAGRSAAETVPTGTLQRGLAILSLLAEGDARPTVGDLMASLELSRSAAYRILAVLRAHRLVTWDSSATGEIALGGGAILLGMAALSHSDVWEAGREPMRHLADEVGESVLMAIVDGGDIVYVAHEDRSDHVVGVRRLLGVRRPLHITSLGKAYAAALPDAEFEALVARLHFAPGTATTITDERHFRSDIAACRQRGYAIDDGEQDEHVMCVGAAVLDQTGAPVCALSIAGPRARIEPRFADLADAVRATAYETSLRLGCPPRALAPISPRTTTKGKS